MVAITPMFIMVLMTSVAFTAIFCAIFLRRDGLADGHFAPHRRGGHFEGVFGLHADAAGSGTLLDALLLLVARTRTTGDV